MFGFGSIEIFVLGVFKYIWTWMFPKIVVPQNGWFIMGNLIKMDDLGVPLFSETPICIYIYSFIYIVDICFFWNTSLILFGCLLSRTARRCLGFSMVKLFFYD